MEFCEVFGPGPLGSNALEAYAMKNKFDKAKNGVTIPPDDHYRPPAQVFLHSDVRPYGRITEGYAYIKD